MRCTVLGGGVILTDDFSIIRSFMGPKNPSYLVIALLYCVILSDCLQFYSVILSDIYCIICPQFYVFCDSTGSPTHFVTPAGDLEREVGRAPFGRVTFDSDEASIADRVPVGFAGGVVDDDVGLVHIQVQKMSNIRALCITVLKIPSGQIKPMIPRARGVIISHFTTYQECGLIVNEALVRYSWWPTITTK